MADSAATAGRRRLARLTDHHGVIEIEGKTVFSTHDIHHNDRLYSMQALKQEMTSFPAVQQAGVRYSWDGEQAYGMLERSNPLDKITRD